MNSHQKTANQNEMDEAKKLSDYIIQNKDIL